MVMYERRGLQNRTSARESFQRLPSGTLDEVSMALGWFNQLASPLLELQNILFKGAQIFSAG